LSTAPSCFSYPFLEMITQSISTSYCCTAAVAIGVVVGGGVWRIKDVEAGQG
jgi:hypothetical protein